MICGTRKETIVSHGQKLYANDCCELLLLAVQHLNEKGHLLVEYRAWKEFVTCPRRTVLTLVSIQ